MPQTYIFLAVVFLFLLVVVAGFYLANELARSGRLASRIEFVKSGGQAQQPVAHKPEGALLLRILSAFGMFIARSGLLSGKTLAEMTATLEGAGFRGGRGLGLFIGAKIMLGLLLPVLVFFALRDVGSGLLWMVVKIGGAAMAGLLLPETIATNIRTRHLKQVEAGVPDALDMMVICADAGLALEAGLARVAQELEGLNSALAKELTQTSRELQIGSDMRQAMESLGQRTGLDPLKRLATTLIQSLHYGTPLTQALRSLSGELRQEALIKFEERAGRLPTLMTIPMILFILPCVFLVVAGPAIINVLATLHGQK
ncbi:fimbriae-related membrane protein [Acidocella aquatica]|uniref:Fimbriae-related membrane protein n=1 Tax=Acidocella aquatica TaxID=1922313 RepID=A0ABQ6A3Q7_9PROT|nr:type II secretion system F family protein [Acidocella aquatica]GLR65895.1 fimbriae-related membrane protein [Acidocella aquatica]